MSGRPQRPRDEFSFALAGPAVTAVVALLFVALALALPDSAPAALRALVAYQAEVNLLILIFNLVPAFPLDGGRVARALLWHRSGDIRRATDTAAAVGRGFGYLLIAGGVLLSFNGSVEGLWVAVIGFFVITAARAERAHEWMLAIFVGIEARDLMSQPPVSIPAELSLAEAELYFARHRYTSFPVVDHDGRAVGMLSIERLEHSPRHDREITTAGQIAERGSALLVDARQDVGQLLEQPAFLRLGRAAVVDDDGRPVGIVSLTDIQRVMRAERLSGHDERGGHRPLARNARA